MEFIREESCNVELILFLWYMPDDTTEGVVTHTDQARLQPSINTMPELQPLCSSALVPKFVTLDVGDEGSGQP